MNARHFGNTALLLLLPLALVARTVGSRTNKGTI